MSCEITYYEKEILLRSIYLGTCNFSSVIEELDSAKDSFNEEDYNNIYSDAFRLKKTKVKLETLEYALMKIAIHNCDLPLTLSKPVLEEVYDALIHYNCNFISWLLKEKKGTVTNDDREFLDSWTTEYEFISFVVENSEDTTPGKWFRVLVENVPNLNPISLLDQALLPQNSELLKSINFLEKEIKHSSELIAKITSSDKS